MQTIPTEQNSEFTVYEYTTSRVDPLLENNYRDAYAALGWHFDGYGRTLPGDRTITLTFKRNRFIPDRDALDELQLRCETALEAMAQIDHTRGARHLAIAASAGLIGSALMAGSVFTLDDDHTALSVILGTLAILSWVGGYLTRRVVVSRPRADLASSLTHQRNAIADCTNRAEQLRR